MYNPNPVPFTARVPSSRERSQVLFHSDVVFAP